MFICHVWVLLLCIQQRAKECPYPQRAYIVASEHRQEVNKQVYNFSYDDNGIKIMQLRGEESQGRGHSMVTEGLILWHSHRDVSDKVEWGMWISCEGPFRQKVGQHRVQGLSTGIDLSDNGWRCHLMRWKQVWPDGWDRSVAEIRSLVFDVFSLRCPLGIQTEGLNKQWVDESGSQVHVELYGATSQSTCIIKVKIGVKPNI